MLVVFNFTNVHYWYFCVELALYRTMGGNPPDYHVTLCFGEEFSDRDPTEDKLITAKVKSLNK